MGKVTTLTLSIWIVKPLPSLLRYYPAKPFPRDSVNPILLMEQILHYSSQWNSDNPSPPHRNSANISPLNYDSGNASPIQWNWNWICFVHNVDKVDRTLHILTKPNKWGGGGVQIPPNFADVIWEQYWNIRVPQYFPSECLKTVTPQIQPQPSQLE